MSERIVEGDNAGITKLPLSPYPTGAPDEESIASFAGIIHRFDEMISPNLFGCLSMLEFFPRNLTQGINDLFCYILMPAFFVRAIMQQMPIRP